MPTLPDHADDRSGAVYRRVIMGVAVLVAIVPLVLFFPGWGGVFTGLRANAGALNIAIFGVAALLGAALKGISGFGYSLLVTPVAALVIDPSVAVVVLVIPPLMLNVFQVGETGTGWDYVRRNWILVLAGIAGSAIGVYVLSLAPDRAVVAVAVAVILLVYIAFQFSRRFASSVRRAGHPVARTAVGGVQGFLLGAINLGPILPAYLKLYERNPNRYIGGISLFFSIVLIERVVQMAWQGLLTPGRVWLGSAIAAITLIGLLVGTLVRRLTRLDKKRLDDIITFLLLATAISLLVQSVPRLLGRL